MKKIALVVIFLGYLSLTATAQNPDNGSGNGVNSADKSVYINGGVGYTQALYGWDIPSDKAPDFIFKRTGMSGDGFSTHLGGMFTWKYLALFASWQHIDTWGLKSYDYEFPEEYSIEHFSYNEVNLSPGFIFARESGDMGYTLIFYGFRWWNLKIDDTELTGYGWQLGIRDLSTFPFGGKSLALQLGLIFASAPVKNREYSYSIGRSNYYTGIEAGLGIALENTGILLMALYQYNINIYFAGSELEHSDCAIEGSSSINLSVTYQFNI